MFDVENPPIELLVLMGSRLCMAQDIIGSGGATFFSQTLLINPVNSGVLCRVISLRGATSASLLHVGPTQNVAASTGTRAFADGRVFGEGTTCFLGSTNNTLVIGSNFYTFQPDSIFNFDSTPPGGLAVLSPGTALSISGGNDNIFLRTSWLWIERQAQPSELNL